MRWKFGLLPLVARIHRDERGAVTLETILIIGAIALPILIFLIKFGWPTVKGFFTKNTGTLDGAVENLKARGTP
jgi:Flp pilus assembly pilin Flp